MKSKQLLLGADASEFKDYWKESCRKVHGGEYAIGKRKTRRPFSAQKPIHIVMRSGRASGKWSFRQSRSYNKVIELIRAHARASDLKLYNLAVNSNHVHFLVRAKNRKSLQKFLRSVTGHLARFITGATKGNAKGKFWDALTFTRLVEWGRDFRCAFDYVVQNELEASGLQTYQPRRIRKIRIRSTS
jgi:REP element-mobilizing transposase RayT